MGETRSIPPRLYGKEFDRWLESLRPRPNNHYRDQARRRDANQRAALALVIEELTIARARLQEALRRLDLGRATDA